MAIAQSSHPLIIHLVSRLRESRLDPLQVRQAIGDIGRYLFYEALHDATIKEKCIQTWQGELMVPSLEEEDFVVIPILRAGLPMVEQILPILPHAIGGFMAMKRDEETFESKLYYDRVPDLTGKCVILCDPMLATGGSLDDALKAIKQKSPKRIISLNIIASAKGIKRMQDRHPDISIYIAKIDEQIEDGLVYPGMGDAGDRAFNT
ncbi:MAG: uracil phosphoribosyltransferase [Thiovulaceae bacterium]|nr:uracil phosphoribosyltransferase [Sulfurimonadaceae bacterium]